MTPSDTFLVPAERASPVRKEYINSFLAQNYQLQNLQEKIYLSSMEMNTLMKETRLTDSNPFEYATDTLSPELHEQSLFTFLFILKCES
jgi:hypothetical protein